MQVLFIIICLGILGWLLIWRPKIARSKPKRKVQLSRTQGNESSIHIPATEASRRFQRARKAGLSSVESAFKSADTADEDGDLANYVGLETPIDLDIMDDCIALAEAHGFYLAEAVTKVAVPSDLVLMNFVRLGTKIDRSRFLSNGGTGTEVIDIDLNPILYAKPIGD